MADFDFSIRGQAGLDTTDVQKEVSDLTGKSSKLMSGLAKLTGENFSALSVAVGNVLSGVVVKIASTAVQSVQQIISTGVEFNKQMETYQMGLTNLLGSAEAANTALEAIKEDAARTPFDVAGLVQANQYLISTGINAEDARATINALGDAVAATGGGSDALSRMAQNLQQIANVGKATAMDIRQFAMAGIDIYGVLADYTGMTTAEVQELDVTYELLTAALEEAAQEGGRFYGAMDTQSQTLSGRLSTLTDNATQLAGALTEGLFEGQKQIAESAITWVQTLQDTLTNEGAGAMLEAGFEIVLEFLDGAVEALPEVVNAGIQTAADFINGIINRLPEIAETGGQIVGKLAAGIVSVAATLASAALQLVETIAVQFFTFEWADVGIRLVKGIIEGFLSALPKLAQTVIDGVKNIGKAAQAAAEAASDNIVMPVTAATQSAGDAWEAYNARVASIRARHEETVKSAGKTVQAFSGIVEKSAAKAAKSTEKVLTAAEKLAQALKEQNEALDDTQSAYKTLSAAVAEYNKYGKMSIDTAQSLLALDDKHLALLRKNGDQLEINADAYRELLQSQMDTLQGTEALRTASDGLTLTLEAMQDALDDASESFDGMALSISEMWEAVSEETSTGALSIFTSLADDLKSQDWLGCAADIGKLLFGSLSKETQSDIAAWALAAVKQVNKGFAEDGLPGLINAGAAVVQGLAEGLTNGSSVFLTAASDLMGTFSSIVSATLPGVKAAISAVGSALAALVPTIDLASVATGIFNAVLNMNPIILVVSLIGMLITALIGLSKTNGAVGSGFAKVWKGIKTIFDWIIDGILAALGVMVQGFVNAINACIAIYNAIPFVKNIGYVSNPFFDKIEERRAQREKEDAELAELEKSLEIDTDTSGLGDAVKDQTDATEDLTDAVKDQTEATKEAIAATQEALAEMVRQAKGLVLSDNMAIASRVADNGSARTAQLAAAYQAENSAPQTAAAGGTTVVQNIYSKAQTAADLARETRWEYDRAART